jgi:polyhydroxyalkanoate synthase
LTTVRTNETPTRRLDRLLHNTFAPLSVGLSPVSLALAYADWAWHLGVSPGRQMELAALATQLARASMVTNSGPTDEIGADDDDPRFRHEAWSEWPFSQLRSGFRNAESFWQEAAQVPGMTAHHASLMQFFARQWLGFLTPANWLPTNPVVLQDVQDSMGAHLLQGAKNYLEDLSGLPTETSKEQAERFTVGRDVAVTPGKVVFRNHLIELICYDAQTETVHPEPVLIVPSWIMKYYILDLSPHNSMVRYLVEQGHTVYMLSWRNPDAKDHNLSMDDYLRLGVLDALQAVRTLCTEGIGIHGVGYCLGGTLLAIAAAALGRTDGDPSPMNLPQLKTLTLLAAQTDFSEPGELGLFIDESQVGFMDDIAGTQGYFSGKQMAGSFQFLHSRNLIWTRRMREYLMGEREQATDLMAWNADTTRMPARMHHEYLTALYLHNALTTNTYRVDGRAISISDIRIPVFLVATSRDHISPWQSVHKLHQFTDTEITFVLASGGHNAGIISEPGHLHREYQILTRKVHGPWIECTQWAASTKHTKGSWWPAMNRWLAKHSGRKEAAQPIPDERILCPAPGEYVFQRYSD